MRLQFCPYQLKFISPAGTSRGVMTEKLTAFLRIFDENDPDRYGIGEAAIFPGLSPEADERYFYKVTELVTNVKLGIPTDLSHFPSLQFGFEQAILDYSSGCHGIYFDSPFLQGSRSIEINGLVWMGNYEEMLNRLEKKIEDGFKCIKIKIGAIDWVKEIDLLKTIRNHWNSNDIEIRVDANGAFTKDNVMSKLNELSLFDIHSIEQPIKPGNPAAMRELCGSSPIPIALDEELIGKFSLQEKREIAGIIKPQYFVIKPALTGGFSGATEWIEIAQEQGAGWWITSALESNIGLNALSQWVATLDTSIPQGLGTGALFSNNISSPLTLNKDRLVYNPSLSLDRRKIAQLDWRD